MIHAIVSATKKLVLASIKFLPFSIPLVVPAGVGIDTALAAPTPLVNISIISFDKLVRVLVAVGLPVTRSNTFRFKNETACMV